MRDFFRMILCLVLAQILAAVPVRASFKDAVIDDTISGTIIIEYKDDVPGAVPVAGAEFTIYKAARLGSLGQYISIIDDTTLKASASGEDMLSDVLDAYDKGLKGGVKKTLTTGKDGVAAFEGLSHGMYLITETKAAGDHLPSDPVLVCVPYTESYSVKDERGRDTTCRYWEYVAKVFPKPHKTGGLIIRKSVQGTGDDKKTEFHFALTLGAEGAFRAVYSTGRTGKVKSGDVLVLKDGESVTIDGIPVGSAYSVAEKEANADGYVTKATGAAGKIRYQEPQTAAFVNTKNGPSPTPTPPLTTPPSKTPPPSVRTGDVRAAGVWAVMILAGALLLVLSARNSRR